MKEIVIVYDGNSPRESANNLRNYIEFSGYKTKLMGADTYDKGYTGKVIVVGHHDLSKDMEKSIATQYGNYGMSYCFSGNKCVLIAHRSDLGSKQAFIRYYNNEMQSYCKLAAKYGVPLCFGERDKTRESQYDLLWLQFVRNGLMEFLEEGSVSSKSRELINNESNNPREDDKYVVARPLEINVELELNKVYLKWGIKFKGTIKEIVKIFLTREQIPVKVDSLKIYQMAGDLFCVVASCSVSDYTALFQYALPKLLKQEKKEGKLALEFANIIGLENVSDEQKIQLALTAINIYEDMVCSKLTKIFSKKVDGIVVHSLKVKS